MRSYALFAPETTNFKLFFVCAWKVFNIDFIASAIVPFTCWCQQRFNMCLKGCKLLWQQFICSFVGNYLPCYSKGNFMLDDFILNQGFKCINRCVFSFLCFHPSFDH